MRRGPIPHGNGVSIYLIINSLKIENLVLKKIFFCRREFFLITATNGIVFHINSLRVNFNQSGSLLRKVRYNLHILVQVIAWDE